MIRVDLSSSSDRLQLLVLGTLFNGVVGVAFLLSTFFTTSAWGTSAWFQPATTAIAQLAMAWALHAWLKNPDVDRVDVLGAFSLSMDLLLFQTAVLWGGLAGGVVGNAGGAQPAPCVTSGGGGDRATSAFAWILLVSNGLFGAAAFQWRKDFFKTQGGLGGGYSHIPAAPVGGLGGIASGGAGAAAAVRRDDGRDAFLDEGEGGL